jgi:SAM-dependent methyltransferase
MTGDEQTVGDLYEHGEAAWASGAELVYQPLADALVASSPVDLSGRRALDAGAGTGAGSRALSAGGALPVAIDLAWSMLAHDREHRPPSAVADLYHPPFRPGSLGVVLAPFVLNHVGDPAEVMRRLGECLEPGGVLLASTFAESDRLAVKDVIDEVALAHGMELPPAYLWVRSELAPLIGDASAMREVARGAGLVDVEVFEGPVDVGIDAPEDLVAYRFGVPHVSRFLDSLDAAHRAAVVAEAVRAVTAVHDGSSLAPRVVFLSARTQSRR